MSVKTPQLVTLILTLAGAIGAPTLATNWVHAHLPWYVAFVAAGKILHACLPSMFGAPSDADQQATGLNKAGMILLFLMFSSLLTAQTVPNAPQPSNGLVSSAGPLAIQHNGAWEAASFSRVAYDVADVGKTKATHIYAGSIQLLAPNDFSIYAGELAVQPDLSKLFKNTNLPAFNVVFSGAAGPALPASGGASSIGWLAGGRLTYQLSSSLTWNTVEAYFGGYGSQRFPAISTGLQLALFGPKAAVAAKK